MLSVVQRRQLFDLGERIVPPREGLLHKVLAVGDRSGHPRAVAMQVRSRLGDKLKETPSQTAAPFVSKSTTPVSPTLVCPGAPPTAQVTAKVSGG